MKINLSFKGVVVANLTFLMYVNGHMYAAQQEALLVLNNASLLIFIYFVIKFEIDAIRHWNPFGSYTPSINNPRCAYHHVPQGCVIVGRRTIFLPVFLIVNLLKGMRNQPFLKWPGEFALDIFKPNCHRSGIMKL